MAGRWLRRLRDMEAGGGGGLKGACFSGDNDTPTLTGGRPRRPVSAPRTTALLAARG